MRAFQQGCCCDHAQHHVSSTSAPRLPLPPAAAFTVAPAGLGAFVEGLAESDTKARFVLVLPAESEREAVELRTALRAHTAHLLDDERVAHVWVATSNGTLGRRIQGTDKHHKLDVLYRNEATSSCTQLASALESVWGSLEGALLDQDASGGALTRFYLQMAQGPQRMDQKVPVQIQQGPGGPLAPQTQATAGSSTQLVGGQTTGPPTDAELARAQHLNVTVGQYGRYQPFAYAHPRFTPINLQIVCNVQVNGGQRIEVCVSNVRREEPGHWATSPMAIILWVTIGLCLISCICQLCLKRQGGEKAAGKGAAYGYNKKGYVYY